MTVFTLQSGLKGSQAPNLTNSKIIQDFSRLFPGQYKVLRSKLPSDFGNGRSSDFKKASLFPPCRVRAFLHGTEKRVWKNIMSCMSLVIKAKDLIIPAVYIRDFPVIYG